MVTNKIRHWLIFFRSHTGSLEAPIAGLGAAAAIGTLFDPRVAVWALVGLIYHWAGYSQNSYYDWKNGYDKDDPHKQHHPLNTGDISPNRAKWAANLAIVAYLAITLWLVRFNPTGIAITITAFVCGLLYNLVGKQFKHKHLLLSISHSSLFIIPYTTYKGFDLFSVLIFVTLILQHTFQIAISGDIKDMQQEESSVLNDLGIELRDKLHSNEHVLHTSRKGQAIIGALTLLQINITVFTTVIAYNAMPDNIEALGQFLFLTALSISLFSLTDLVVRTGRYKRTKRLQYISMREVVGFWLIYSAIIPIIGFNGYVIALILSICYVIIHSKFMWGTLLRPKV